MNDFVTPRVAAKHFGVGVNILRDWEKSNQIECIKTKPINGQRRYNLNSYKNPITQPISSISNQPINETNNRKESYCYCRVSSLKQKDDLGRQEEHLKSIYPTFKIIKDIGSGLNFKRPGLISLLENSARGCVKEIVVAYKDRLCRFGFDLLLWMFTFYGVKITILGEDNISPDEELSKDILSIIHVFSCRANGRRKYKKNKKEEIHNKTYEENSNSD